MAELRKKVAKKFNVDGKTGAMESNRAIRKRRLSDMNKEIIRLTKLRDKMKAGKR